MVLLNSELKESYSLTDTQQNSIIDIFEEKLLFLYFADNPTVTPKTTER